MSCDPVLNGDDPIKALSSRSQTLPAGVAHEEVP
jgi:hypothetical protein